MLVISKKVNGLLLGGRGMSTGATTTPMRMATII